MGKDFIIGKSENEAIKKKSELSVEGEFGHIRLSLAYQRSKYPMLFSLFEDEYSDNVVNYDDLPNLLNELDIFLHRSILNKILSFSNLTKILSKLRTLVLEGIKKKMNLYAFGD